MIFNLRNREITYGIYRKEYLDIKGTVECKIILCLADNKWHKAEEIANYTGTTAGAIKNHICKLKTRCKDQKFALTLENRRDLGYKIYDDIRINY